AGSVSPSQVTAIARPARPGTLAYGAILPSHRRTPAHTGLLGSVPAGSANLLGRLRDRWNSAVGRNTRCSALPPHAPTEAYPLQSFARPAAPPPPPLLPVAGPWHPPAAPAPNRSGRAAPPAPHHGQPISPPPPPSRSPRPRRTPDTHDPRRSRTTHI